MPSLRLGATEETYANQIKGSGIQVSFVAGTLPSDVYGYFDSIDDGKITCSPHHTSTKPTFSATLQVSSALLPSVPILLANAKPNFIFPPLNIALVPQLSLWRLWKQHRSLSDVVFVSFVIAPLSFRSPF